MKLEIKEELKRLQKVPYSKMTKEDIYFLTRQGIINWVWPQSYWKFFRAIASSLFSFLQYEIHDINFFQQIWFHKSNWGILKYSFISLANDYKLIFEKDFKLKLTLVPLFYLMLAPKVLIILLAYNAVESKAWLRAYNKSWKI